MNGSAPKTCLTGSHARAVTKPRPNRSKDGPASPTIFQTIAPTRTRHASAAAGAGSSFVAPLVSAWIPKIDAAYGIKMTYGPIGSGGGINAITNRTVDFGASDAPLTSDQFAACKGCVQIPWALSATSLAYNGDALPNHIHLTGPVLASIFNGHISKWNDAAIKKLNKGKSLPDLKITVIHRSDNSGTRYNLT